MENLRRGGGNANLPIMFGAKLHVTLDTRRRMLRSLTFIAMRQHQCKPRKPAPLGLARSNELVDDDLGAILKIANCASHTTSSFGLKVE